jgi:hypothetical protein
VNEKALLELSFAEATAARGGQRAILVELRCKLPGHDHRAPVIGTVYRTKVGDLLVAITDVKVTTAMQPGRTTMCVHNNDQLPRYWLLSNAGAVALAHPSPLTTALPAALAKLGERPVTVQCPVHRRWIDCPLPDLAAAVRTAKTTRKQTLMLPV